MNYACRSRVQMQLKQELLVRCPHNCSFFVPLRVFACRLHNHLGCFRSLTGMQTPKLERELAWMLANCFRLVSSVVMTLCSWGHSWGWGQGQGRGWGRGQGWGRGRGWGWGRGWVRVRVRVQGQGQGHRGLACMPTRSASWLACRDRIRRRLLLWHRRDGVSNGRSGRIHGAPRWRGW